MQSQQVILPTVKEPWVDDPKEPQFIKVRGNNTSTLYIGDMLNDKKTYTSTIQYGNDTYFQNIKRMKMTRLIVDENSLYNINSYNNRFKGTLTHATNPPKEVDFTLTPTRIIDVGQLIAYMTYSITDGKAINNVPSASPPYTPVQPYPVPELTFQYQNTGWFLGTNLTSVMVMGIGAGWTFTFDPECSFYKYGDSMFGLNKFNTAFYYLYLPTFKPYNYINVVSNTLCRYVTNKSLTTDNSIQNIIYRYYFGQQYNDPNAGWINWNKSAIPSFDISLLDPQGNLLSLNVTGSGFIAGEILMEQ